MSLLLLATPAWAHRPGISYVTVESGHLSLVFARPELTGRFPMTDLLASRVLIAEATLGKGGLSVDGQPCTLGDPSVREVENDGVEVWAGYDCPEGTKRVYDAAWIGDFEAGHRSFFQAGETSALLDVSNHTVEFSEVPGQADVALEFAKLGVEHIWTGYDHLAFLLGLLLTASRLKEMLLIVTGFTVAHSITLSLAATEVLRLSPEIVEPAIAASIAYVGIENFWRPGARRRVVITFLLGFIHGFGFAGLLAELGLPKGAVVLGLAAFNAGVEAGQAVVVLLALPVLLFLRRFVAWEKYGVPVASVGIAMAGLYWFVERVWG